MYYATIDNDGHRIAEGAKINAFETLDAARAYILDGLENPEDYEVTVGAFGDCWFKMFHEPTAEMFPDMPFDFDNLSVRGPGGHPGGKAWWIEPRDEVLVATLKAA